MLLEETYHPDMDNRVSVDLSDIVTSSLTFTMPSANDTFSVQNNLSALFTVRVNGSSIATFTAVRSGVENLSDTVWNFLTANWLTWQPQVKEVLRDQPEWLTYYAPSTVCFCYVKFYYTDGTSSDVKVCDVSGCISINTRFSKLWALDTSGKNRYGVVDVYVVDSQNVRLTYPQRYVLRSQAALDEIYLCENTLGGIDTFRFNGDRKLVPEIDYTSLRFNGSYIAAEPDVSRKWSQNTGMLTAVEGNWCWELFRATAVYHLYNGAVLPVVIDSSSVERSAMSTLSSFSFNYRYASDRGLLSISKSENLPDFVEIPGPNGEVFFLAPRLVDFPDALAGNSLLFPVQSPFEQKWYKMTLGEIRSQVLGSVAESGQFLSRLADDIAKGNITFEKMIQVLGLSIFHSGAEFGSFIKSLQAGTGAGIDASGNAEFESVRVRSYFECLELIVNRLSVIEGDQLLTEADTIDSVSDLGNNCFGLTLRRKWEGYFTAQVAGNVLKGIFNTLSAGSGQFYTSWMRVNSVNAANNYIEVTMYPDEDTPAGKNHPPVAMMKIARWGNQTDATRQSCIYLSSTEGRIVRLTGVTKPIVDSSNYGASFGTLPDFLKSMDLPIVKYQDYLYARGLIVQDIIRVDYAGKPVSEIVDRGPWGARATYYCEDVNPDTGLYEISDVWHMGCRWRCAKTCKGSPPAWNNTDWFMIEGNPGFSVDFRDTDYIFDPDRFNVTLSIVATLYNQDVTADILDADVQWTRYSEDADGNERVTSDQAWALKRAGAGKSLALTSEDCDFNGYIPGVLRFTATVTLRDGMNSDAATASAAFEL